MQHYSVLCWWFQQVRESLSLYLQRFSSIAGNMINCGPVLSWLEVRSTSSFRIIRANLSVLIAMLLCVKLVISKRIVLICWKKVG